MPYIKLSKRGELDGLIKDLAARVEEEGELNYCFYKLSTELIARVGESYAKLAMCSSAMEHAKLEWYRRRLSPYEDKKIKENGDI
ncbi:MAG: DUF6899 family protein [Desulfonatronovibrionaceae bacterium]